jgi:hypothetical protein
MSCGLEKEIFVWSMILKKPVKTLTGHVFPIFDLYALENSPFFISADVGLIIKLYVKLFSF